MAVPLLIGAAAFQTVGSLVNGANQAQSLNQQADAANYNATASDIAARGAFDSGVQREGAQRRSTAQALGQQRAASAESGIDPNSGSALDVQLQSTRNAELDALQTRYEGILTGQNYEQEGRMYRYQADTLRQSASRARTASYVSAAASALAGGAGAAKLLAAPAAAAGASSGLSTLYGPYGMAKIPYLT